jgi:hypothetical protein
MLWTIVIVMLVMWTPVLLSPGQRGRARLADPGEHTNTLRFQSPRGPKGPREDMTTTTAHRQYRFNPRAVSRNRTIAFRQAEVFDAISFQSTRGPVSFLA